MAAHFLLLAPSSTDVERNLIASPSPTQAISSDDVVICRRVVPTALMLVEMAVRCEVWIARLGLRAVLGVRCVFMHSVSENTELSASLKRTSFQGYR